MRVKILEYIPLGFYVYHRSYSLWSPVILIVQPGTLVGVLVPCVPPFLGAADCRQTHGSRICFEDTMLFLSRTPNKIVSSSQKKHTGGRTCSCIFPQARMTMRPVSCHAKVIPTGLTRGTCHSCAAILTAACRNSRRQNVS